LALIRPTAATRPSPTPAGAAGPEEDTNRASALPVAKTPPGRPGAAQRGGERDALTARARELLAGSPGRPPGRRALARELGVTEHQARTVLDAITPTTATTAMTGARPRAAAGDRAQG